MREVKDAPELRPCPHCPPFNRDVEMGEEYHSNGFDPAQMRYCVVCRDCGARISTEWWDGHDGLPRPTPDDAAKLWNMRDGKIEWPGLELDKIQARLTRWGDVIFYPTGNRDSGPQAYIDTKTAEGMEDIITFMSNYLFDMQALLHEVRRHRREEAEGVTEFSFKLYDRVTTDNEKEQPADGAE